MKPLLKTSSLIFLGCCIVSISKAQALISKFEWGFLASGFVYQGDLTPSKIGSYRTMKPGISLYMSTGITSRISLRTNLAIGGLKGDDAKYSNPSWRPERA